MVLTGYPPTQEDSGHSFIRQNNQSSLGRYLSLIRAHFLLIPFYPVIQSTKQKYRCPPPVNKASCPLGHIFTRRPLLGDSLQDPLEEVLVLSLLPAHKLGKVAAEVVAGSASVLLVSPLGRSPHSLDSLGVGSGIWVDKVVGVVHGQVIIASLHQLSGLVPLPAVRVNGGARCDVLLDGSQQCPRRSIGDLKRQNAHSRSVCVLKRVDLKQEALSSSTAQASEDPSGWQHSTSIVLPLGEQALIDLNFLPLPSNGTLGLSSEIGDTHAAQIVVPIHSSLVADIQLTLAKLDRSHFRGPTVDKSDGSDE